MRCKACHYSLKNLTEHRCPECGRDFDPNDPSTFSQPRSHPGLHGSRVALFIVAVYLAVAVLSFFGMRSANTPGYGVEDYPLYAQLLIAPFRAIPVMMLILPIVLPAYLLLAIWHGSRSQV